MTNLQTNDRMPNAATNHAPTGTTHPTAPENDLLNLLGEANIEAPAKSSRKWWIIAVLLLLLLVTAGYFIKRKESTAVAEFKTSPATRGDITQSVTANGQITPIKTVTV